MEQTEIRQIKRGQVRKRTWILILIGVIALGGIGYWLLSRQISSGTTESAEEVIYTCPMHSQIQSKKPGECPICGMKLVPKRKTSRDSASTPVEGSVMLSHEELVRANVQSVKVVQKEFVRDIQAVGTIKIAEPSEHIISSRTRGRIEHLYVNATGRIVRKGEPLYDYYSPDLLNAEQEYLIAIKTRAAGQTNTNEHSHSQIDEGLINAGKERLRLYGLSGDQITELEKKGVPRNTITILSPESGVVLQKLVQEGSYIDEGTSLFQLADLSVVWAEIQIPESDIRFVRDGYPVSIGTTAYPSEKFQGNVIFISPVENPDSRTITVRLALPNAGRKLRPEMFISAIIHINMGNALAVPVSAVTRTGSMDYVWIRNADGSFSRRDITIGATSQDDFYQVLSGLEQNDEVASSGQFLIDSEHQFAKGANPMAGMNMDAGSDKTKSSGEGIGTVRGVDNATQTIIIDHGVIPGVMSAMTMGYKVSDPALLGKTKTGDRVKFTLLRNSSGGYIITEIATQ